MFRSHLQTATSVIQHQLAEIRAGRSIYKSLLREEEVITYAAAYVGVTYPFDRQDPVIELKQPRMIPVHIRARCRIEA